MNVTFFNDTGGAGTKGEAGNAPFVVSAATSTAPAGARIGDKVINGGAATYNIGGTLLSIGDIGKITSLSPFAVVKEGNIRGETGATGYTPTITESVKTSTDYRLKFKNASGEIESPNLMGGINLATSVAAQITAMAQWANASIGTEYWTGKYYINGKKIYGKKINFGNLPNAARKDVAHGVTNSDEFVTVVGTWKSPISGGYSYGLMPVPGMTATSTIGLGVYTDLGVIGITTGMDRTVITAIVTLEYTCTNR